MYPNSIRGIVRVILSIIENKREYKNDDEVGEERGRVAGREEAALAKMEKEATAVEGAGERIETFG